MKTLTVVTASDLNHRYLDCVPSFIDFWLIHSREHLRIIPNVVIVADELPTSLAKYSEFISIIPPNSLSTPFIAQNIRTYTAGTFATDHVMTSDVDMLPLNIKDIKFALNATNGHDSRFIVLRDVLPNGQFPICYSLSNPETWRKVMFGSEKSTPFEMVEILAKKTFDKNLYDGMHGGIGWFIDQELLYQRVISSPGIKLFRMTDAQTGHRRLDRAHHPIWLTWFLLPLVPFGFFTDYHVHHPIREHRLLVRSLTLMLKLNRKLSSI